MLKCICSECGITKTEFVKYVKDETTITTMILNVRRKYTRKKIRVPDGI